MRVIRQLILTALSVPLLAVAGEIRGILTKDGKPFSGAAVQITIGDSKHSSTTDKFGSYRVMVPEKGKCSVMVEIDHVPLTATVYSFDRSVQYDLAVVGTAGNLSLQVR